MKFLEIIGIFFSMLSIRLAHIVRYAIARAMGNDGLAGVRITVDDGERVLLVKAWHAPFVWTLPGGGVHCGETYELAAQREALEETGLSVAMIDGVIGRYTDWFGEKDVVVVFYTTHYTGALHTRPDFEIIDRRWFSKDALPYALAPVHRKHIERYLRGVRNERGPLK